MVEPSESFLKMTQIKISPKGSKKMLSLGMMRPLNFEKLDVLTSGNTLCLIKNANRVLSVCEVILEIKRFVVHSADGIREIVIIRI